MSTINTFQIQNRPLRIGFPSSTSIVIDYFFEGSGVVPGETQLILDYNIGGNNDGVAFADGRMTHQSVITLSSSNPSHLFDTLLFIRRGVPVNSDNIFGATITARLDQPGSTNSLTINAFITC